MARHLGEAVGRFLEVDCDQDNFCWGDSLRIKILVDISKPLHKGIWIDPGGNQGNTWIQIKYERLPDFCYGCDRIGHTIKDSLLDQKDLEDENGNWQFDSWLRFQGPDIRRRRRDPP